MSGKHHLLVAAEVTRLKSQEFQNEPPHVGCYKSDGGVEK